MRYLIVLAAMALPNAAHSATPETLLKSYADEAAVVSRAYSGPSAAAGDRLFHRQQTDWSCATCHTADPRRAGRHVVTGKTIRPLAPAADPTRFRDRARADKWFKRNCNDTLGRECTSAEKADVLAYLISTGERQ